MIWSKLPRLCFSYTSNIIPQATKKHLAFHTMSDKVNQMPPDTSTGKKIKKSRFFHVSSCAIDKEINPWELSMEFVHI